MNLAIRVFSYTALILMVGSSLYANITLAKTPISDKQAKRDISQQVLIRKAAIALRAENQSLNASYQALFARLSEQLALCEALTCKRARLTEAAKATKSYADQSDALSKKMSRFITDVLEPELTKIKEIISDDLASARQNYKALQVAMRLNADKSKANKSTVNDLIVNVQRVLLKRHQLSVLDVLSDVYMEQSAWLASKSSRARTNIEAFITCDIVLIHSEQDGAPHDVEDTSYACTPFDFDVLNKSLFDVDKSIARKWPSGIELLAFLPIREGDELSWLKTQFKLLSEGEGI